MGFGGLAQLTRAGEKYGQSVYSIVLAYPSPAGGSLIMVRGRKQRIAIEEDLDGLEARSMGLMCRFTENPPQGQNKWQLKGREILVNKWQTENFVGINNNQDVLIMLSRESPEHTIYVDETLSQVSACMVGIAGSGMQYQVKKFQTETTVNGTVFDITTFVDDEGNLITDEWTPDNDDEILQVDVDGLGRWRGVGKDYTISGTNLVFEYPQTDRHIAIFVQKIVDV